MQKVQRPDSKTDVLGSTEVQGKAQANRQGEQDTAKVFMSGNSQAVRLPKAYRFDADIDTLDIQKVGDSIVLTPTSSTENGWAKRVNAVFDALAATHDDSEAGTDLDLLVEAEDIPPQEREAIDFHEDWAGKGWTK